MKTPRLGRAAAGPGVRETFGKAGRPAAIRAPAVLCLGYRERETVKTNRLSAMLWPRNSASVVLW